LQPTTGVPKLKSSAKKTIAKYLYSRKYYSNSLLNGPSSSKHGPETLNPSLSLASNLLLSPLAPVTWVLGLATHPIEPTNNVPTPDYAITTTPLKSPSPT
jgi:hypothetical protein